ncbi:MAG: GNAT family N-acetyltransferase, partial [Rhodoplanes sp.]
LLLGPLAVHPDWRARGIGALLMRRALAEAGARGHAAVLLVGDAPYYARFGFSAEKTGPLSLPGPYEADRLVGRELTPGALDGAGGLILAARAPSERRGRATGVAPAASHAALPHAA